MKHTSRTFVKIGWSMLLLFAFFVQSFWGISLLEKVDALEKRTVFVNITDYAYLTQTGRTFELYVYELKEMPFSEKEQQKLLNELNLLSEDALTQKYGAPLFPLKISESGKARLELLDGFYYVRQKDSLTLQSKMISFFLAVDAQTKEVYSKTERPHEGGRIFFKASTTGAPLKDAKFRLYIKNEKGEYLPYAPEKLLVSDEKGYFSVQELPYGTYFLQEIEAPKDHKKLTGFLPFEINEVSSLEEPMLIVNHPNVPPLIDIPYTGNAFMLFYLSFALLLFLLGLRFVSLAKHKENT